MLSYRHLFHAGNHADVVKHITLCAIIDYLKLKDKPISYIDTHSGAGMYSLQSEWSNKTGEYKNGIQKIYFDKEIEELIPSYFNVIRELNDNTLDLNAYPGSPYIAASLLGEKDDISLIELHPNEYKELKYNMYYFKNVHVHHREAKEGLNALLPPKNKRALILIDPSYEMPEDYHETLELIKNYKAKFPQGICAIWYPVLGKAIDQSHEFVRNIGKLNIPGTLQIELNVAEKDDERGMNGSGMIICNAPYKLDETMKKILPLITQKLAINDTASFKLNYLVEPL